MTCTLTPVPYPSVDVVSRYNAILNPEALSLTNWGYYAGGGAGVLISRALTGALVGPPEVPGLLGRMEYGQTTTATAGVNVTASAGPAVTAAGVNITVSAYVRTNSTRTARIIIDWRNTAGTNVGYSQGPLTVLGPDSYLRLSVTGVTPATATTYVLTVQVGVTGSALAAGDYVHVAAPLAEGVLRSYFSGSSRAAVGSWVAWAGTANAAVSAMTTRTVRSGLVPGSTPTLVLDFGAARESASVAQYPIGRADPVHALGPLKARTGSLDLFFATLDEAQTCVRVHEAARVMLRDTEDPLLDMYYVPGTVTLAPTSERTATQRYRVTVGYTEVYATAALY